MKNTKFKNKAIQFAIPIVATTALVYAQTDQDYTPGNYIIIGNPNVPSNNSSISISGGSTSYETYLPQQQATPFQSYSPPQWNLYNTLISSLGNLGFGAGNGLYDINLANPSNLAGVFGEIASPEAFANLELPAVLYAVGTYAPVLKEALVGADNISKQMTMFTTQAINSIQNAINALPDGERQAVQACISYNLSGGQNGGNFAGLSMSSVTNYLSSSGQSQFNKLVDSCMQGESIVQAFGGNAQSISNYINQFNPRNYMADDIQQAGLQPDQNNNLVASDTVTPSSTNNLTSLFNPQIVAKDMLIATQPAVQYNSSARDIVPQFVYITLPSGSRLLVSLANFDQDIKAIVDEQMNYTLLSMTSTTDFDTYYNQYVVPVNNALSLTGTDFYNYWYTLYNTIQTYLYAYQNGTLPPPHDNIIVTPQDLNDMKEQIDLSVKNLKNLYIAYFEKETLKYLQQDALENEQKYKAEQVMNSTPAPPPQPANQNG